MTAHPGPIVVLGDVFLDIDVDGHCERYSQDDAPIVDVTTTRYRPGGAGLAARLAAGDADEVVLVGGFANDHAGQQLRALLEPYVQVIGVPLHGSTVCKQRVRADGRCTDGEEPVVIARCDSGTGKVAPGPIPTDIDSVLARASGVLVSDYGRGMTSHPQIRGLLRTLAPRIPVVWDPHPLGSLPIPDTAIVTPNRSEALRLLDSASSIRDTSTLARLWSARAVAVTLGPEGAYLCGTEFPAGMRIQVPPGRRAPEGADICGAGDRFAAAVTVVLAEGESTEPAVRHAVSAAAEFVCNGAASSLAESEPAVADAMADVVGWR
ncbi:PfkB family carbohydrate kinase [Nocardia rosealba]|uniref:PfkB family carbohydrate kinase n=1 Tax=Nocardia rosealba TaxID=2878563 RepID=UPI001CD96757|nr:PfkB family carbohydrate kinase [Nocardia rosealba]MCA2207479.1 PfkB family carbohydrate kinase [Nocardia rosealba]